MRYLSLIQRQCCSLFSQGSIVGYRSASLVRFFSTGGQGIVMNPGDMTLSSSGYGRRDNDTRSQNTIRLSKLLASYATNLTISRNTAETLIKQGEVTVAGETVSTPQLLVDLDQLRRSGSVVIKVQGKGIQLNLGTVENDGTIKHHHQDMIVVYAAHKLAGEVVTENDPQNRPSMMKRLMSGGVGQRKINGSMQKLHLKPIGRLDIPTEGLCLVTNDGDFARQMELPSNQIHRIYRARVHGKLTSTKLQRIRNGGIRYNNVRYGPMKINVEKSPKGRRGSTSPTNTWVQITANEGKNRQIRNVFEAIGSELYTFLASG